MAKSSLTTFHWGGGLGSLSFGKTLLWQRELLPGLELTVDMTSSPEIDLTSCLWSRNETAEELTINTPSNVTIDWGDGSDLLENFDCSDETKLKHTYADAKKYKIRLTRNVNWYHANSTQSEPTADSKDMAAFLTKIQVNRTCPIVQYVGTANTTVPGLAFAYCTKLVNVVGNLFNNIPLTSFVYQSLFSNCINLQNIPEFPISDGIVLNIVNMFYNCKSMVGRVKINTKPYNLTQTFYGCEKLTAIDELTATESELDTLMLYKTFEKSGIESISSVYVKTKRLMILWELCAECHNLREIGSFVADHKAINNAYMIGLNDAFLNCDNLTAIPQDFLGNHSAECISYKRTFEGCTGITTSVPHLWDQVSSSFTSANGDPHCFSGCVNAANYDEIPDAWK